MNDERLKLIPIIALTASATGDVRLRVQDSGMNDYVSKPFRPEELLRTIAQHINVQSSQKHTDLAINLEKHSRGKKDLKDRLVRSAIQNIEELKVTFDRASEMKQPELFSAIAHKCKMTITFLKDEPLSAVVEQAEQKLKANIPIDDRFRRDFNSTTNRIMTLLREQLSNTRP